MRSGQRPNVTSGDAEGGADGERQDAGRQLDLDGDSRSIEEAREQVAP